MYDSGPKVPVAHALLRAVSRLFSTRLWSLLQLSTCAGKESLRAGSLVGVSSCRGSNCRFRFARAALHALDLLLVDSAAARARHAAFPNLKDEFAAVPVRYERGPLEVQRVDPAARRMRPVRFERENYGGLL